MSSFIIETIPENIEMKRDLFGYLDKVCELEVVLATNRVSWGIVCNSKEDIDAAVTYGIGRRLPVTGPLVSADMGGLDVFSAIADYLFNDLSNAN